VKETVTYKMTYGDKESGCFGLELSGVRYSFKKHYAVVLKEVLKEGNKEVVCGLTIAHLDERNNLVRPAFCSPLPNGENRMLKLDI
jgi:alpha 1,3-mannosyltransferase